VNQYKNRQGVYRKKEVTQMDYSKLANRIKEDKIKEANRKAGVKDKHIFAASDGANVRIVETPELAALEDFAVLVWYHYDPKPVFLCPKRNNLGSGCPVCDAVAEFYNNQNVGDNKALADKFKAGRRYVTWVLERGREEDGLKLWFMSATMYATLAQALSDEDPPLKIMDVNAGYDIKLTAAVKKSQEKYQTYDVKISRRSTSIGLTQEQFNNVIATRPDLLSTSVTLDVETIYDNFQKALDPTTQTTTNNQGNYQARGLGELVGLGYTVPQIQNTVRTDDPIRQETPEDQMFGKAIAAQETNNPIVNCNPEWVGNTPQVTPQVTIVTAPIQQPIVQPVLTPAPIVQTPVIAKPAPITKARVDGLFKR
jgi:hypothetical protein